MPLDVLALDVANKQSRVPLANDTYNLPRSTTVAGTLTATQLKAGVTTPLAGEVSAKNVRFDDGTILSTAAGNNTVPTNLASILPNGATGNIAAGQQLSINDSAGTSLFAVDEATGKVTAINLAGMLGNISAPLVDIPFKRANDEKALSGVQTFNRSTTGTYVDTLDGLVKTAAINAPRFERMSDGGTGLLMEGSSTNEFIGSATSANMFTSIVSDTLNAATTSPDGTSSAKSYTVLTTVGAYTGVFTATATVYTFSGYIKVPLGLTYKISIYNIPAASETQSPVQTGTGTWQRVQVTNVAPIAVGDVLRMYFIPGANFTVGTTWDHWGLQLEALPFATSYIPTTVSPLTRASDSLTIPTSGNLPSKEITIVCDAEVTSEGSRGYLLSTAHYTTGVELSMPTVTSGASLTRNNVTVSGGVTRPNNTVHRVAATYDTVTAKIFTDGILNNSIASSSNLSAVTFPLNIGPQMAYSRAFQGHLRNFRIYDRALTTQEIAAA